MKFAVFAKYLEKLEGTSSRNEMTVILAQLFGESSPEDARLIAYLSAGRLGPAYNSPDTGVADKMMVKALGGEAEKLFKQKGDLGLVAQEINKGKGELSVGEVYKKLLEMAGEEGTGSQEKKQQLIRELLDRLDAVSAKYVVKIILGKLRTGFSDMTVLDSLSWMIGGDKKSRPAIEKMYNVRADLGEIALEIVKYKKPREIEPEVGTPILMARAERAKNPQEIWERMDTPLRQGFGGARCALEYKLDGLRIQAHVAFGVSAASARRPSPSGWHPLRARSETPARFIRLFSRGLEDVTAMYPDVVEGLRKQIKQDCIVEGEMIAVGSDGRFLPFQETVQRKRKYDITEMSKKVPLKIFLFDVLVAEGKNVMHEANDKRRGILEKLVKSGETVKLMPRIVIDKEVEIEEYFQKALKAGTEGIVAKKLDGPYQAGARDFNWIKYKKSYTQSALSDTIDAVVMGYDVGQGKRSDFGIGDFLIGVYDPSTDGYLTVAKIGTGLIDEEWREMKIKCQTLNIKSKPKNYNVKKMMECDFWVSPKIVVEILADEITKSPMHSSGYALRFPRLVSFRDKKPEDVTSVTELQKLFKMQKGGE